MDENRDLNREDDLFAEANRWFFRLQAEDVSSSEKQQFSQWLNDHPSHAKAWSDVHVLMCSLRAPAQASYDASQGKHRLRPRHETAARGSSAALRWIAACLALAIGVTAYVQGPVLLDRWNADYATVAGERQSIMLADGTRLELNTDTAVKTDMTSVERRVTVLRGEAFFDIANDARPFVVSTRYGEIRDIGTAFSVGKDDGRSTVTVESGIVDVKVLERLTTVRLTAGQTVNYGTDGVSDLKKADLDQDLAWRRGQIVFRQEKLSGVVKKLNRYRAGRIVIVNPWIADELVSGTFNIDHRDGPIAALEEVLGVKATYLTSYLVALR
jgi:transmembrane sensor